MADCRKCGFWVDCNCYGELVDKINEKIKQWDGDTCWECGNTVAEELKSLLEDNKK